ncbi:MAG: OmpA family protein [Acidobacteria bacterium]|nr:OmpA family protein [Acidobacteriota bacterium]
MKPTQPVIIIKKNRGGHGGHHGGAWKVAYADFVTAMMAFFLVMWLVGASPDVKKSVAGYFRDPGVFDFEKSTGMMAGGMTGIDEGRAPETVQQPDAAALTVERQKMEQAAEHIRDSLADTGGLEQLRDQIEFSVTEEGLRIELLEKDASSFFDSGSPALRGESVRILSIIGRELGQMTNDIVVEGHTDSRPFGAGQTYSNWELSADRANAARRVMEAVGLNPGQVQGVRGFAATQLRLPEEPMDPRNRRVSIVVRSQSRARLEESLRRGTAPGAAAPPPDAAPSSTPSAAPPAGASPGAAAPPVH